MSDGRTSGSSAPRPECKRRWQSEPWEKKERAALRNWLLERCEDRDLWYVTDDRGGRATTTDDCEPASTAAAFR